MLTDRYLWLSESVVLTQTLGVFPIDQQRVWLNDDAILLPCTFDSDFLVLHILLYLGGIAFPRVAMSARAANRMKNAVSWLYV